MRALISFVGIALFAAGCFNPSVKSGGFACDPTVLNACPTNFFCVNQRCLDHPGVSTGTGGNVGADMTMVDGADMTMSTPDQPVDMAVPVTPPDLSTPPAPPPDLAKPVTPPDLAQPNSCAHDLCTAGAKLKSGCSACATAVCAQDSFCCSSSWDATCVSETDKDCSSADQC